MNKSLEKKIARIHADPHGSRDFILADAKDADMALSIGAPGRSSSTDPVTGRFRSLAEYRELIEQIIEQRLVDIVLMSASTNELLTIRKRLFDDNPITPAARANDTTDVHILRGSNYASRASLPFRTATLDHIQSGRLDCNPEQRQLGANLGLYSITFNNDSVLDRQALEEYRNFRIEAERKGFRHFLEVFDPNQPGAVDPDQVPGFINDAIVRTLAGVTSAARPLFLKMVYHGPAALEELVHYDPHLVVGVLGGSAGTTYDAFKLLSEAKKYGARAALFGRKINNAENQLAFVSFLRLIADGMVTAEEAVEGYHGVLGNLGIAPKRSLDDDLKLQSNVMSYGGRRTTALISEPTPVPPQSTCGCSGPVKPKAAELQEIQCECALEHTDQQSQAATPLAVDAPDFGVMNAAQKVAYHRARWDSILG